MLLVRLDLKTIEFRSPPDHIDRCRSTTTSLDLRTIEFRSPRALDMMREGASDASI